MNLQVHDASPVSIGLSSPPTRLFRLHITIDQVFDAGLRAAQQIHGKSARSAWERAASAAVACPSASVAERICPGSVASVKVANTFS